VTNQVAHLLCLESWTMEYLDLHENLGSMHMHSYISLSQSVLSKSPPTDLTETSKLKKAGNKIRLMKVQRNLHNNN
jgi:hypothetical protein